MAKRARTADAERSSAHRGLTKREGPAMGADRFPFREAEVHAAADAEAAASADYLAAADLLPAFSRRHADADEVASLARLLLASVMASGLAGSLAAGAAVNRAADRLAVQRRKSLPEVAAGDTFGSADDFTPADHLARANYPAPDQCARLTDADRLAMVRAAMAGPLPMTEAADQRCQVVDLLASLPEAWGQGHGAAADQPSGVGIGSAMVGGPIARGRRSQAWANLATEVLASLDAGDLPAWAVLPALNGEAAAKHERGIPRDSHQPTSGPASAVVRTVRSGQWVTLADRSVMVTDEAATYVLGQVGTLPAFSGGTAGEVVRASLGQQVSGDRPGQRVPGVTVDRTTGAAVAPWGHAHLGSGGGKAASRPAASRKRKRDGGIGSPMVPASR